MLRAPLVASRVVVAEPSRAAQLAEEYPEARVRLAPIGVLSRAPRIRPGIQQRIDIGSDRPTRFGVLDGSRLDVITRAMRRANDAGANAALVIHGSLEGVLDTADVVLALQPPPFAEWLVSAAVGLAAAKPVIALETEATAGWPALDPQTWQPRGFAAADRPILVTIDPRDEEHSLTRAILRLSADAPLREALGGAARTWWAEHATIDHALRAWRAILVEAQGLAAPPRPREWPTHLTADGSERARDILSEFGLDFVI